MTATTEEFAALTRVLDERWTCRQFHPQPVARETILALLRLAQRTPSWCNTQPSAATHNVRPSSRWEGRRIRHRRSNAARPRRSLDPVGAPERRSFSA
ncbi:nitroreductase family protein [Nocardia sp. Marseille-Q1738]